MSMIGNLRGATDAEIQQLLTRPEEIWAFLHDENQGGGPDLMLEKMWHAIHFMLVGGDTEGEAPLNFLLVGEEIGDVDVGYGPAHAVMSADVQRLHEALQPLDPDSFAQRIDLAALDAAGVYPDVWGRDDEAEWNRQGLTSYYDDLRNFIATLVGQGKGLIAYIN
jgi:hypothetical protein